MNNLLTAKHGYSKFVVMPMERWHLDFIDQGEGDIKINKKELPDTIDTTVGYTAFWNSYLMFCGGVRCLNEHVGEVWCVSSQYDKWEKHARFLCARTVIRYLKYFETKLFLDRLQCFVVHDYSRSISWLMRMGFVIEGYHSKIGPDGEDMISMARVK